MTIMHTDTTIKPVRLAMNERDLCGCAKLGNGSAFGDAIGDAIMDAIGDAIEATAAGLDRAYTASSARIRTSAHKQAHRWRTKRKVVERIIIVPESMTTNKKRFYDIACIDVLSFQGFRVSADVF